MPDNGPETSSCRRGSCRYETAIFLQHPGSDESVWRGQPLARRMAALREAASAEAWRERVEDVPFVLDRLEEWNADPGHALHGRLDLSRVGMSGHSFGARTTQAMMGQAFPGGLRFGEPRLKAFLKGDAEAEAWLRSDRAAAEAGLVPEDRWQWK